MSGPSGTSALSWDPKTERPDVAILVALKEEFRELKKMVGSDRWSKAPNEKRGGDDYVFTVESEAGRPYRVLVYFMDDMGQRPSAHAAERLLDYEPAIVVNVGIACSLDADDVRLCDVIVANQVDGYDEKGKAKDDRTGGWTWSFGGQVFRATHDMVQLANQLEFSEEEAFGRWQGESAAELVEQARGSEEFVEKLRSARHLRERPDLLKVHLASGVTVAAAEAFQKQVLARDRNIKALDMEALAVVAAAQTRREAVKTLVLRGISDLGDADKKAIDAIGDGAIRRVAMRNAVRLLFTMMQTGGLPRVDGERGEAPRARNLMPHAERLSEDDFEEYRRRMRARHECMQIIGHDRRLMVPIRLDDLYVELDVVVTHGAQGREVYDNEDLARKHLAKAGAEVDRRRVTMAGAFGLARAQARRGLVLLGDPGSGKTTQLQRMLMKSLAEGGPEELGLPAGTIPVFLPLRELSQALEAESEEKAVRGKALRKYPLSKLIEWTLSGPAGSLEEGLGERLVQHGRLLLLFDGLDEVASAQQRLEVAEWIGTVLRDLPESYALVSSRYAGYTKDVDLDHQFLEMHLRPLNEEQVGEFVSNWYQAVRASASKDDREAGGPEQMLAELRSAGPSADPRLVEISANPLMLTALCLVFRRSGRLPRDREALYRACVEPLLDGYRRRRGKVLLPGGLEPKSARLVLQRVALWMHGQRERRQASADELVGPVMEGFEAVGHHGGDPRAFLGSIRNESGLLTGWGMDLYGFMHLGLQEYLAALELRGRPADDPALRRLAGSFGESWWQEVILLMLADGDEARFERFLELVVQDEFFADWVRSPMMVRVMAEPTEAMARPLLALLQRSRESDDEEMVQRQLAAAQLLGRRMPAVLDAQAEALASCAASEVRAWLERWRTLPGRQVKTTVSPRGGVELVEIPGGTFMMGSPKGDEMAYPDEQPQHEVTLVAFELARTPVTNRQYAEYLAANPDARRPEYWGSAEYGQPDQPVVGVSWNDAMAYCKWAGLTLPTEAQWEYACRARTTTRYHSGDTEEDLKRVGWYDGNSGNQLHAVAELEPNEFGLYDMHGNIGEWCLDGTVVEDGKVESYSAVDPRSGDGLRRQPVGGAERVVRGGDYWGFLGDARGVRSAFRYGHSPEPRHIALGFRPARVIS